jgi:hypothetical protein
MFPPTEQQGGTSQPVRSLTHQLVFVNATNIWNIFSFVWLVVSLQQNLSLPWNFIWKEHFDLVQQQHILSLFLPPSRSSSSATEQLDFSFSPSFREELIDLVQLQHPCFFSFIHPFHCPSPQNFSVQFPADARDQAENFPHRHEILKRSTHLQRFNPRQHQFWSP